jgi:hypothetical protein
MKNLRRALVENAQRYRPVTDRQLFYRLVNQHLIAKEEREYKSTIVRLLTDLRLDGEIPFHWIADNTRWDAQAPDLQFCRASPAPHG